MNRATAAAKRVFQQALVIDSFDPVILANYGRVLEEADGNHAQAEMLYRRAIDLQPDDANTLCNLACLLVTKDQDHKGSCASIPAPFQHGIMNGPILGLDSGHMPPNQAGARVGLARISASASSAPSQRGRWRKRRNQSWGRR